MEYFKTIKIVSLALVFLLLSASPDLLGEERETLGFEVVGPPETVTLEKTLRTRLGVYAWGIWPRSEKFDGALPGKALPNKYVERLQSWLPRILKKEFLPRNIDPNEWQGLTKMDGFSNFIVGKFPSGDKKTVIEFKANGVGIVITAVSENYFPNGAGSLTNDQIIKAITALVNYPEDKVKDITIEKHFEEMGDPNNKVLVCYGKIRAPEPTVTLYRFQKKVRTWWSYMPFWMTQNKVFISSTMVNWENFPASLDPYVFKF